MTSPSDFPLFALLSSTIWDESTDHTILSLLESISDCPRFIAPGVFLADLRNTSTYFRTTERLIQTFTQSLTHASGHKENQQPLATCITLFARNLLRAQIFLQLGHPPGFRILGPLDIGYRHAMKRLSWQDWYHGCCAFLSLFEHTESQRQKDLSELTFFISRLKSLRLHSPHDLLASTGHDTTLGFRDTLGRVCPDIPENEEAATAVYAKMVHKGVAGDVNRVISGHTLGQAFTQEELQRRFGPTATHLWQAFCQPMTHWNSFLGRPLRRHETSLELHKFTSCSHELAHCPLESPIALSQGPSIMIDTLELCLHKLKNKHPFPHIGLKDFTLQFAFGSGHQIKRQVFLNEPVFDIHRTARAILEQIAENVLVQPGKKVPRHDSCQERFGEQASQSSAALIATADGLALRDPEHPERLYFINHIVSITTIPIRIALKTENTGGDRLFSDTSQHMTPVEITHLRRELLVHHGQDSLHYQAVCALTRPFATQPPPKHPPEPTPHLASDIFSHAFRYRPPAVLRRPTPFIWPHFKSTETEAQEETWRLVFMESQGNYDFFVWLYPEHNAALWLGSPALLPRRESEPPDPKARPYVCLGFFDSLDLLPNWICHHDAF